MVKRLKNIILSILISVIIIFSSTVLDYKEAQAGSLALVEGAAAIGGLTIGGVLATALAIVAVGYGCYLVVDNWEEITTACADFLSKTSGAVKEWWDKICGSAVKVDDPTIPLPQQLNKGQVINFFDYYTPMDGGGGGEDPNNKNKLDINPQVLGALYSFLCTYYAVEALNPDQLFSSNTMQAYSIDQLKEVITYQPARLALENELSKPVPASSLTNLGILYALMTPNKPVEMYGQEPVYMILDIPDLIDTIFVGVKDDGTCSIFGMGINGTAVGNYCNDTASILDLQSGSYNDYLYPKYNYTTLDMTQEPFLSTFSTIDGVAAYYANTNSWINGNRIPVKNDLANSYTALETDPELGYNGKTLLDYSLPTNDYYNVPFSFFYNSFILNNDKYLGSDPNAQKYTYDWKNVIFKDGNLIMGNYNVNFVGGTDYFYFYSYDYEDWLNHKDIYAQKFKWITMGKGRIEGYVGTTFEKFIPGETYSIPKSKYRVVLPQSENVQIEINDYLMNELAKINTNIDKNFDRIIEAINAANEKSVDETGQTIINQPIIKTSPSPDPNPNANINLEATNELIEGLPQAMAEAINVPGALKDAFTPTGDFTSLNKVSNSFGNFFNFNILYEYHEMIETFFNQRISNENPPVFCIYPKQSGLVYFQSMPNSIPVIKFDFMEEEVFTWGITVRYFIRCLLTFFVLAVWLNRTIKKLPGIVSGI